MTPPALAATPASMTRSPRLRRHAMIRAANIRSHTRIGSTSARGPNLSATTCRAKPTTVPPIAVTHSGCRTRSSRILGDSTRSVLTRFVLRCSATDDIPNTSAAMVAAATAIGADNRPPVRPAPLSLRHHRYAGEPARGRPRRRREPRKNLARRIRSARLPATCAPSWPWAPSTRRHAECHHPEMTTAPEPALTDVHDAAPLGGATLTGWTARRTFTSSKRLVMRCVPLGSGCGSPAHLEKDHSPIRASTVTPAFRQCCH
jgi:hypothetical protein